VHGLGDDLLPVPLSPVRSTVVFSGATRETVSRTACIPGERPMTLSKL
jgi:hypothetical protein